MEKLGDVLASVTATDLAHAIARQAAAEAVAVAPAAGGRLQNWQVRCGGLNPLGRPFGCGRALIARTNRNRRLRSLRSDCCNLRMHPKSWAGWITWDALNKS